MSTFRNPVGPQASNVYWRRRLVVGIALLAVIIIVLLIVFSPKGDGPTPTDTKTPGTSSPPPEELGAGSGTGTDATDAAACNPDSISLEAVTDQAEYQDGQLPLLSMKITNLGAAACSLNVGTDAQLYSITSGEDAIWNSTDCQTAPEPTQITLEPGAAAAQSTAPFSWDRTRSSATTCDKSREPVAAGGGTYRLAVSLGTIDATESKPFLLY